MVNLWGNGTAKNPKLDMFEEKNFYIRADEITRVYEDKMVIKKIPPLSPKGTPKELYKWGCEIKIDNNHIQRIMKARNILVQETCRNLIIRINKGLVD